MVTKPDPVSFGNSTSEQRAEWNKIRATAARSGIALLVSAAVEANRIEQATHAYAMGWYDARKDPMPWAERERLMGYAWSFPYEFAYASFLFHSEQAGSLDAYGEAWQRLMADKNLLPEQ